MAIVLACIAWPASAEDCDEAPIFRACSRENQAERSYPTQNASAEIFSIVPYSASRSRRTRRSFRYCSGDVPVKAFE